MVVEGATDCWHDLYIHVTVPLRQRILEHVPVESVMITRSQTWPHG